MSLRKIQKKSSYDRGLLSFDAQVIALRRDRMSRMKKIDVPGPHKTIEERTPEKLEYYYSLIAAAQQKRMSLLKKYDDQRKASALPEVTARQDITSTETTEVAPDTTEHNVSEGVPREITVYKVKQKKSRLADDIVTTRENSKKSRATRRSRCRTSTRKEAAQRKTCCLSVSTHETSESTLLDITERTDDDDDLITETKSNTPKEQIELLCKLISLKDRIRLLKRNQAFWNNHPARFGRAQPGRQDSTRNLNMMLESKLES